MSRAAVLLVLVTCLFNADAVSQILPPPAPLATAATNIGQTSFTANWNAASTATSYVLTVATDSIFRLPVAGYSNLIVGNVLTLNVTGLSPATVYFYRVRATNAGGTSPNSNVITLTTVVATPPPPLATPATNVTQTSFTAHWDSSTGATTFFLDVAIDSTFKTFVPGYANLNAGNVQALNVVGLAGGTTYYYHVRGSNVGGTSGSSNIISVTTIVATPPPPLALPATNVTQTSFTANWNPSTGATAYFIDVSTDSTFTAILPSYNNLGVGSLTTQNIAGLGPGTKYFYRIRGSNVGGTSGNSNIISVTTVVAAPPPPVATLASGVTQTSFAANWNASAGATAYLLDVASDTNFTSILPAFNNLNVGSALTRNVTGLNPETKYFYRVRGNNVGGTSGNSNVISVTSVVATPPAPVATAASGVATTSFNANWNAAAGATSYLFDLASDTNFTAILPAYNNLNVGNVQTRNITGLTPGTKYFYRVRGSNAGGTSGNSNIISLTTVGVPPPPPVLTSPANGSTGQAVVLALAWNASPGASSYLVQVSTNASFIPAFINDTALTLTTRALSGLAGNTTYFWRVAAKNQFGVGAFSSSSFSTISTASVTGTVIFPEIPAQRDYRMVSVPGITPVPVSDLTAGSGGLQKVDWRAFYVSTAGALTELDPLDQMNAGEGVWLIRKNALNITKSPTLPPLQPDGTFFIQIHGGWNIIANPFVVPVRWDAVRAQNGLLPSDVIQGWSGSYVVDSVMEPFKGYYYYNSGSATTTLAIPYPLPGIQSQPVYTPPAIAWSLQVTFESGDNTDADCHLGILPGAGTGGESFGIRKPPLAFTGGEIYFSRPGPDGKPIRFSTDYRPGVNGTEEWDIQIAHPGGCTGVLRFAGVNQIPSKYRVILVSPDDGWPIDLRSQNAWGIRTALPALTVRVLVGVASDIDRSLSELLPASYTLGQNYPNPFNPSTTIRYGLPQRSNVDLAVYNNLGQKVAQLVSGEQAEGYHEVKFDGSGLASGMYFYRIRAGQYVETKRLLLLR